MNNYHSYFVLFQDKPIGAFEHAKLAINFNPAVIVINIELITSETPYLQWQGGVEVLKYIRLMGCNKPCILYSARSLYDCLISKPKNIILCSKGNYFLDGAQDIYLPNKLENADLSYSAFSHFIRMDFNLPDDRHSWANWWGIKRLCDAFCNYEKNASALYSSYINDKLKQLESLKAIYLYESPVTQLTPDSETKISLKKINKRIPKILHIDDQWHNGWSNIFVSMLYKYNSLKHNGNGEYTSFTGDLIYRAYNPIGSVPIFDQIQSYIDNFGKKNLQPDLILLDLRLNEKDTKISSIDVTKCSGAELLKKIRTNYKGIPVLITTASNKAWSYEQLIQLGADAYWIKEGLDEQRNTEHSFENYKKLISIIERLTGYEYQFLKEFTNLVMIIKNHQSHNQVDLNVKYWWEYREWGCEDAIDKNGNKINLSKSECDVQKVTNILGDIVSLLRIYLNSNLNNNINGIEGNWVWFTTIIKSAANIIEEIHFKDGKNVYQMYVGLELNRRNFKMSTIFRGDYIGQYLFSYRNKAAHNKSSQSCDNFIYVKIFLSTLISWLLAEPFPQISFNQSLYDDVNHNNWEKSANSLTKIQPPSTDETNNFSAIRDKLLNHNQNIIACVKKIKPSARGTGARLYLRDLNLRDFSCFVDCKKLPLIKNDSLLELQILSWDYVHNNYSCSIINIL